MNSRGASATYDSHRDCLDFSRTTVGKSLRINFLLLARHPLLKAFKFGNRLNKKRMRSLRLTGR